MHYETTSQNSIDGEWSSIILSFSDGQEFVLQPIFFAFEDREQNTELPTETYKRLSIAVSVVKEYHIPAGSLWEKTDTLLTDAASKNLKIEGIIATSLE